MKQDEIIRLIREPNLMDDETLPHVMALVEKYPFFQAGWMLLLKNLQITGSPEFGDYLKKAALRVADRKVLYMYLHRPSTLSVPRAKTGTAYDFETETHITGKEDQSPGSGSVKMGRIESFLREKPSIRMKPDSGSDKGIDISESSATEHDDFATETLAEIYVRQNNLHRAIQSFEKLILKYPEKNAYFASRIEEIKKML